MQRTSSSIPLRAALVVGASLTALSGSAVAQRRPEELSPQSPVTLEVTPVPRSTRWTFALVNGGPTPVDVVVDRNLLSVEITGPNAAGPRPRRRPRSVLCRSATASRVTEGPARVSLRLLHTPYAAE